MKKLILLILISFQFAINCFSQNIGYFNYGQSGKASWSNHVVINSAGELVMAGYVDSKPCIVVANVTGAYVTNRVVASAGELFSATIDAADNIYGGGYYGSIGAENKYIVKYNSAMTQVFTKNYGSGNIRYLINDGTDVVAAGFNTKPCVLKIDAAGNIIWYKEYTINGKNADAYMIHKEGSSYYITGSFDEGGNAKSYVLSVDVTSGNVNWCSTYVGATFSPHFTGMAISATGIILCGATASSNSGNPGNLIVVKIDFTGNVLWTRQINGQYSWYMRNPTTMGNSWGISCAIDQYGDLVVAGETENNYSMLAKLKETTGTLMWTKRYGNGGGAGANDDGFHGITISGCTYLASGWMGPSVGSGWDFGLIVCDTSGYAGSSATCGTVITKVNSAPAITVATSTVTSINLTTATNYAGQNVTANFSRVAVCSGSSSFSITATTSTLCSGGTTTLSVSSGATSYAWASTNPGSMSGSISSTSIVVTPTAPTNYTCFVGGTSGCLAMLTISVSPTAASGGPTVTVNSATLNCSNASATLTATGGGTYSWIGPGIVSGNSSASAVINQPGTYTVAVTSGGCTSTTTTAVSSVGGGTLSVTSQTNINCFGINTGTAAVIGSGGAGPYTYTWTPGNLNGAAQTNLAAGIYTVNMKDATGCLGTATLQITQPTSSVSAVVTTTAAACGSSNGVASVTASGGTAGYTYNWLPSGGTSINASNLVGGNYTVTVTDTKGCTVTAVANITSANGPTLSITSQTNINCFGANTGAAVVAGNGGISPYTYTWMPGNLNGASQTSLTQGTYTINVSDVGGCIGTNTLTVTQPTSAITAITTITAASCGSSNGAASVNASGGTPGYTYNWLPSGGTSINASNLASGNYSITVTDTKGCTVTAVANITSANGPTLSITSQTNINCFGSNTGAAVVVGSGGTSPYTYTWMPGNLNGSSQTSLTQGTYTINVSDVGGCIGTNTLTITQPTSAIAAATTVTVASCGSSNGAASVNASGGTPGYTYNWLPSGGTSTNASNLTGGNYSVTVTDTKGCTVTAVANITSANGPTLSITSQTNINCFGANTGAAVVAGNGGASPYTYTWMPGNLNGASQTSLTQGTYTINVSDAGGCIGTNTLTVTQPTSAITAVTTITVAGCGSSNGIASVTPSGGTPGYTYNWLPSGGTSINASNLAGGNYSITVTDTKGCTVTAVANITSANGPTLSITSQTNINCFGANTGAAVVAGNGGASPYTYTWMPGNLNGSSQTSLTQGTYTINVSDASGCIGTNTLTVTQPTSAITGTISTTASGCGTSVGSATVSANGGTPNYTYNWSPVSGTGTSISGLAVGNYSVLITDSKGCSITVNGSINSSGTGPALSITSQTNTGCGTSANGAANINATGTGPYSYTWSPSGGNSATATSLASGNYTVFVSDAALCSSTIAVTITQSPPIVLTLTSTPASCVNNDGTASLSILGGIAPITILWSINSNSSSIGGLSAGTYSVLVTDAAGCSSSGAINITTAGTLTVDVGSNVTILEGQTTPLNAQIPFGASITWSPSEGLSCINCPNPVASPTVTTNYCALTTIGTCTNTSCVSVTVKIDCSSNSDYSTPNAFTPNDDGINDEYCLKGWKKCINTFYIAIYNRWGEKVYDSDDADFCWDGKFRGMTLNSGVFVFYIKATLEDGSNITRKGNINLIR